MSEDGQLPGKTAPEQTRIVLHVDNDCFYAACERLRDETLVGEPVVVGMGYDRESVSGAVATASYEARAHGIQSAQPISEAIERLPPRHQVDEEYDGQTGLYRPVDMGYYEGISGAVHEILASYAETFRVVSIDEAYLDCTTSTTWEEAKRFGERIKERIATDVGVPTSVGIAPNMSVAKIASDHDKPDGLVVVPPDEMAAFLAPLPIEDMHGVGPVTAEALKAEGLETVGDIATTDPGTLSARFGKRGAELHRRARGIDERPVRPRGDPKSLSRESSFGEPVDEHETARGKIEELAAAVAERSRREGATYRTIGIKVVEPPFDVNTRERSLPGPVDDPDLVREIALNLLSEFRGHAIRKVGVRVSNLEFPDGEQPALESWKQEDRPDRPETTQVPILERRGQTRLRAFLSRSENDRSGD